MNDHPAYSAEEEETGHIHETPPNSEVWKWTGIATATSLILNLILYFIGSAANWIPEDMPTATEAFSLLSVVLMSTIPVVLFGVLMVFLANNAPRASRLFTIILLVVLIIAVMVPFTLQGLDTSFQFLLVAMHIVTVSATFMLARTPYN